MPRQDTKLESEGAEFLVLGQLLINRIPAYKTYTNMPGYDVVATNPEKNTSARLQVKSRWDTNARGFLINRFDTDFVVLVKLNRGSRKGNADILNPQYYVFPVEVIESAHRKEKMPKVVLKDISELEQYENNWESISIFLESNIA